MLMSYSFVVSVVLIPWEVGPVLRNSGGKKKKKVFIHSFVNCQQGDTPGI